jgi:hypothetical protein
MNPLRRTVLMRGWQLLAAAALIGGGTYWWLNRPSDVEVTPLPPEQRVKYKPALVLQGAEMTRQELLACLALAPGQGFPASYPWTPLHNAGTKGLFPLETLLHYQPLTFLEHCLEKYTGEVKGYRVQFHKRERIAGKLNNPEKLDVHFRETPFSVHMRWLEGAGRASAVLFVRGENNNKMLAKPNTIGLSFFPVSRDVDGPDAKAAGRFTIDQFGIGLGTVRTVTSMRAAQRRGQLHVRYEGIYRVPELGDRTCYKLIRSPYVPLEEDALNELTVYIDTETLLQTGSVLRDAKGELLAEYWFREVDLNPTFKDNQFQRSGL